MWQDIQYLIRMFVNSLYPITLIFIMSNFKYNKKIVRIIYILLVFFGILINSILFYVVGRRAMMLCFAVSIAIPSLISLLILTRDKFAQILFNFFTAINVLYFVSIIGRIIAGMDEIIWLDALIKAVLYSVILYLFSHYFSTPYHFLTENMKKGWLVISIIPLLFFAMVMYLGLFPRIRSDNFPAVLMLYGVLCCIYIVIYKVFKNTYDLLMQRQASQLLSAQYAMQKTQLTIQMENMEQLRILRHDMRHFIQTIGALLKEHKTEEALQLLETQNELFAKASVKIYCKNVIINTVLSYYISHAEEAGIEVVTRLDISEQLPVDAEELATVFANAFENAYYACLQIAADRPRRIFITVLSNPRLILEISNTYDGQIVFDENHVPITHEQGHGYGTQSILAFTKKNNAILNYKAQDGLFSIRLLLQDKLP